MKALFHSITVSVILAFIMMASSSFSFPRAKKIPLVKSLPDSLIATQLGTTLSDILLNPTTITLYSVKGKEETNKDDYVLEPHYVRDSLLGVLSADLAAIFEFILISDENNYVTDSVVVRSPYMPQLEFEFSKKKQVAHVLLSTSDFSWTVVYDGKKQFNYNYKDNGTIERFCEMIMKKQK